MTARLRWRKLVSAFMLTMTGICAAVAVSVLFFILGYFVYNGGTPKFIGIINDVAAKAYQEIEFSSGSRANVQAAATSASG